MVSSRDFCTAFDRLLEAFVDRPFARFAAAGVGVTPEGLMVLRGSGLIGPERNSVYAMNLGIRDQRFLKPERELREKGMLRSLYVRYQMHDDIGTRKLAA